MNNNEPAVEGVETASATTTSLSSTTSSALQTTTVALTTAPPTTSAPLISAEDARQESVVLCFEFAGYDELVEGLPTDSLEWVEECISVTQQELIAGTQALSIEGDYAAPPPTTTEAPPRQLTEEQNDEFGQDWAADKLKPVVIEAFADERSVESVDEVTYLPETNQVNIVLTSTFNGEQYHDEDAWEYLQVIAVLWDEEDGALALEGIDIGLRLTLSSVTYSCDRTTMIDLAENRLTKGDAIRAC